MYEGQGASFWALAVTVSFQRYHVTDSVESLPQLTEENNSAVSHVGKYFSFLFNT